MALGTDDVQTTGFHNGIVVCLPLGTDFLRFCLGRGVHMLDLLFGITAEHDIRPPTRHVGGNGDRSRPPGLGNNLGFALVELGVQHLVSDLVLLQPLGQILRRFNGGSTHQHRRALGHRLGHFLDDSLEFFLQAQVHQVIGVNPHHGFVGGNHHHIHAINLAEFQCLGVRSTGHAGQLVIKTEIILEGGGRQGLVFLLDIQPFFRLDGLMNTFGPATPRHGTAGVFIHDHDLVVLNNVIPIDMEQGMGFQRRMHMVEQRQVMGRVQAFALLQQLVADQQPFNFLMAGFSQLYLPLFFINEVIAFALFRFFLQLRHQLIHRLVELGGVRRRAGNNQWGSRFIDQDGIHLIDDGVVQPALHTVFQPESHIVTQVIETVFVVGPVGDIRRIRSTFLFGGLLGKDDPH